MHTCIECSAVENGNWMESVKAQLAERQLCHTCNFWHEKIAMKDDTRTARIEGTHYRVGDEGVRGLFQGFGGAKFVIKFNDGREVTTTNLWAQGKIPQRFKDRLPDNATFVYTTR